MLFNSFQFLIFYLVVVAAFFAMPARFRWILLLLASYYFYMCWQPAYAVFLAGLTLVCYLAAILIELSDSTARRRFWLVLAISMCVGLLVFFKYIELLTVSLNFGLGEIDPHWHAPLLHLIIPVGISFHTFQSMGYITDVYRRTMPAERHLGIYAVFIVFFPQLLAGPIERSSHMLPQFHVRHALTVVRFRSGARWILWGLFKKMAVADLVAGFVSTVYAAPRRASGTVLLLATFFFSIQIYCDFSGYSDMAVGLARIMGYDLLINFKQPYMARGMQDFWSRWHISLSTWFRDYLYIPLGGSRVSRARWALNILVVFLISGLWHGDTIIFAVWGLIHGIYLLAGRATSRARESASRFIGLGNAPRLRQVTGIVTTFILVTIAWVFFRARSLADVSYILSHIWRPGRLSFIEINNLGFPQFEFALAFAFTGLILFADSFLCFRFALLQRLWKSRSVRWACYAACFYAIVFFGVFEHVEFIYFQF